MHVKKGKTRIEYQKPKNERATRKYLGRSKKRGILNCKKMPLKGKRMIN
jgi:hypothetical protein